MGEEVELVGSYLRRKLSSILNEAAAEGDASSSLISRFQSIERRMNSEAPIEALYDLIHELSECRVFVSKSAAFKKGFFYWFRVLWFKKNMTSRLDRIEERLLNVTPTIPSPPSPPPHNYYPETRPIEDPSLIIGFEAEAQKIEGWLLGEDKRVGIVGRCGVGKTALAQKVFSSPKIREEFSPRIWVCLSNELDVEESRAIVLNYILKEIGGDQDGGSLEELQDRLMGKRYLIVLDDVWRADDWYANIILPGGAVIATGRREDVIRRTVVGEVIRMEPILRDETCWRIFSNAVERQQQQLGMQNVLRTRTEQEITEYCHGLPLAANVLATVLMFELWIPARELYIAWGNDTRYWTWISLPPPRVEEEVAVLIQVWWLEIRGRVELKKLLLRTYYSAYLVFKLKSEDSSGLSEAMMSQVGFGGKGEKIPLTEYGSRVVYLNNIPRGGKEDEEEGERCLPQPRDNEWMEIKLGDFFNNLRGGADDQVVEAALYEVHKLHYKSGLIVKGIHFRPNCITRGLLLHNFDN